MSLTTVFKTTRPSFLALTPICVSLGLSTALLSGSQIDNITFLLILIGASTAHISVNTLNEYYDFSSGLDLQTERTAFSGGSGALPENPKMAATVKTLGFMSLLLTVIIGIYLMYEGGTKILPLGLMGVLLIITYTHWLNRSPLLCLIAPGLGFGILMVIGTHVILSGEYSQLVWLVALVPFFLINNLLLLNQYPDMQADANVGRKTFPIAFGIGKSNYLYAFFFLTAYALIFIFIVKGILPFLSLIALIPMAFSILALLGANKHAGKIGDFPHYLGANVAAALLTPLLLAISILMG